ncbi:MAG TPA: selenocysteine-specific translation elongation factor [Verrucomicrobiota bacterium]|nr:selenocysteine-specific translation elongation factor [Verrucomicrobiota bacterium]HNU52287.1 selenocysteine-specific translation elongation factor [Verrucomicrobiota bacterium]
MNPTRHCILATAGHVDHGKSALVKMLTGTDPDRLPEEKARGITIDLGFAHLELAGSDPVTGEPIRLSVGIVDVPGHEDFVRAMVAGVGSVDAALLVIAADDGWMPQTEEHLQILEYLGMSRAVVALSKTDLAADAGSGAVAAVRSQLEGSALAEAPIVRVDALSGEGADPLRRELARVLARVPPTRDAGKPRLAVDRVFSLRGVGTVATGTLTGGSLRRGQRVVVCPQGTPARIRSLQSYHHEVDVSPPGARTAVQLADIERREPGRPAGIGRGDVVTVEEVALATDTLDVHVVKSGRLTKGPRAAARPLRDGMAVWFHQGTSRTLGWLLLREKGEVGPGEGGIGQLRLASRVSVLAGDRFILRDASEQATLAGGLILNVDAPRRGWRAEGRRQLLDARRRAPEDPRVWIRTGLALEGVVSRGGFLARSRFGVREIREALEAVVREGDAVPAGECVFDPAFWRAALDRAVLAVDAGHRDHPERPGLSLVDLRQALPGRVRASGVFDALLGGLAALGFCKEGAVIRRREHRPVLPVRLRAAGDQILEALAARPWDPPSRAVLAPDALRQAALKFFIETGQVIEVTPELVFGAEAYGELARRIRFELEQRGRATVSELRVALGTNRRVLVPLLEKLDRDGVTRREGDYRVPGPGVEQEPVALRSTALPSRSGTA